MSIGYLLHTSDFYHFDVRGTLGWSCRCRWMLKCQKRGHPVLCILHCIHITQGVLQRRPHIVPYTECIFLSMICNANWCGEESSRESELLIECLYLFVLPTPFFPFLFFVNNKVVFTPSHFHSIPLQYLQHTSQWTLPTTWVTIRSLKCTACLWNSLCHLRIQRFGQGNFLLNWYPYHWTWTCCDM